MHGEMIRESLEADDLSPDSPCVAEAASEIYRRMEVEGFTDELLEMADALSERVGRGELRPARMPGDSMLDGRMQGIPMWFRTLYHLLASTASGDDGQTPSGSRAEIGREVDFMTRYAKARGVWSDDLVGDVESTCGSRFAEGGESYCYWMEGGASVAKVNSTVFNRQPSRAMERLMLHNFYFPEASLRIDGCGVMRRTGKHAGDYLAFLLSQTAFDFSSREVSESERNEFMARRGFVPRKGSAKVFVSTDPACSVTIGDLNVNNIRWTKDGDLVVLDAIEALNLPCYGRGGSYSLDRPPARIHTTEFPESARRSAEGGRTMANDEMDAGMRTCDVPYRNPYYDPEKMARLAAAAKRVTWESLRDNAFIRADPDAVVKTD